MKKLVLSVFLAGLASALAAADLEWLTDLPKAQAKAKAEKKLVLLDFTGSDWCGWCKKLDKEVFSTKEFGDYAKQNLVLVQLDFPAKKPQPAALAEKNAQLKDQYRVGGFPTIIVLDSAGKELWRSPGYMEGGPRAWIAKIDQAKPRAASGS